MAPLKIWNIRDNTFYLIKCVKFFRWSMNVSSHTRYRIEPGYLNGYYLVYFTEIITKIIKIPTKNTVRDETKAFAVFD